MRPAKTIATAPLLFALAVLLAAFGAACGNDAPPADPERAALATLYNSTGGPSWTNHPNWLSGAPLDNWYGVTTDADGRVIRLSLTGNRLVGPIPRELAALSNLQWLELSSNNLRGRIPPELAALSNLQVLRLDDNDLSGYIPPELGLLSNLQALGLFANELSGPIPPELGLLSELQVLGLNDNDLSGEIPPELGRLHNLQALGLNDNDLSGEIPPELALIPDLQTLWLANNDFGGCVPKGLGNLPENDLASFNAPECQAMPTSALLFTPADLVDRVRDSVVKVEVETSSGLFSSSISGGSGFIFDVESTTAFVATNHHVISGAVSEDAVSVDVIVRDASSYKALVLGWDAEKDVAVLSVCCSDDFVALSWGEASPLVGSKVIAVGYPTAGSRSQVTATTGEVAEPDFMSGMHGFIPHTAPLNPGNSGGPLFSMSDGKVLGINTASGTQTLSFYAIPFQAIEDRVAKWRSQLVVP